MGSIAYVRQIYLRCRALQAGEVDLRKESAGMCRGPLTTGRSKACWASERVMLPAERSVEIERMIAFAKEMKMNVVLYGGHEAWRDTDLLKKTDIPVLVSLKYPVKAADSDPMMDEPLRTLEMREKAPTAAGALAKAGVKFAFYSDGGFHAARSDACREESDRCRVVSGPMRSARSRCRPRRSSGVSNRLGSIDKGKIADLVVVDGDLFSGAKVKYVFVDGTKFEPTDEPAGGGRGGRGGANPGGGSSMKKLALINTHFDHGVRGGRSGPDPERHRPDDYQRNGQRLDSVPGR